VAISSGSACTSASLEPSYVLKAMGLDDELAHSSLRITVGRFTTLEEVDHIADLIEREVARLREMSPLWEMVQDGIDLSYHRVDAALSPQQTPARSETGDHHGVQQQGHRPLRAPAQRRQPRQERREVGTGIVGAPACGDVMKLQIKVENGVITDAKFKTYGCGSAIASSSLVTEWVKGMSIDKAMRSRTARSPRSCRSRRSRSTARCSRRTRSRPRSATTSRSTAPPPPTAQYAQPSA
jgi:hypothetical protein